jgi:hypothetical protein
MTVRSPRASALLSLVPLAPLAALAACHASSIVVGELQEITALKAIPNRKLDLLFVIDDSSDMLDPQLALAAGFPRMLEVLQSLGGGLPDLHVGVVTSDMGTLGSNSPTPGPPIGQLGQGGCAGAGQDGALQASSSALADRFISDVAAPDGTRVRNYTGELHDVFRDVAVVGAGGCGFEQHLAATRRALVNPLNAGFLRDDANLGVVILADEDDCSALDPALFGPESPELGPVQSFRCTRFGVVCDPDDTAPGVKTGCAPRASSALVEDVQPFVDALLAARPDPRMVMVAAIVGDPAPFALELRAPPGGGTPQPALAHSCTFPSSTVVADPAVRLAALLDAFPGRSELTSICAGELGAPLAGAARKLVGDPCLDAPGLADTSPDPGLQPACEVIDVRDSAPREPRTLPGCAPGATDCFEIVSDAAMCPTAPDHLRVRFQRSAAVADDTWTHVRCQLRR